MSEPETKNRKPAPAASLTEIHIAPRQSARAAARAEPETAPAVPRLPAATNDDHPPVAGPAPRTGNAVEPPETDRGSEVAPGAIIDLWEHLAGDRLRPPVSDLDPLTIARQWPNSLLLRVRPDGRRTTLEVAHMFAPSADGPTVAIPIDAMTVDWIVALGREVVATKSPVHETDAVPSAHGSIHCGVIALPFGSAQAVDHVLCHLYRVDENLVEADAGAPLHIPARDRTGIRRLFGRPRA